MDLNFDFTEKRVIITAFFCMAFTIANLITVKIISIDFLGMETPAGVLIYPLVYLLTNVIAKTKINAINNVFNLLVIFDTSFQLYNILFMF